MLAFSRIGYPTERRSQPTETRNYTCNLITFNSIKFTTSPQLKITCQVSISTQKFLSIGLFSRTTCHFIDEYTVSRTLHCCRLNSIHIASFVRNWKSSWRQLSLCNFSSHAKDTQIIWYVMKRYATRFLTSTLCAAVRVVMTCNHHSNTRESVRFWRNNRKKCNKW